MDLAPAGHFSDGELGLPESGNGIPDILDELRWGMDWAMQMQDSDGGVYWRVSSGHWDLGLPADVSEPRFLYEKTTRATAQFAAMAAVYARLMAPYDQADANAAWAMTQSEHAGRDILLVESARRAVMIAADIKLERAAQDAYRSPKHPAIVFTGWGNFSISPIDALALLQGYHLSGESIYLDTALQALDIMLGANPQSQVYLTGIGANPVQDPLDRISLNDFNAAPCPASPSAAPPGTSTPAASPSTPSTPPTGHRSSPRPTPTASPTTRAPIRCTGVGSTIIS